MAAGRVKHVDAGWGWESILGLALVSHFLRFSSVSAISSGRAG
jgi:hypothetical protein